MNHFCSLVMRQSLCKVLECSNPQSRHNLPSQWSLWSGCKTSASQMPTLLYTALTTWMKKWSLTTAYNWKPDCQDLSCASPPKYICWSPKPQDPRMKLEFRKKIIADIIKMRAFGWGPHPIWLVCLLKGKIWTQRHTQGECRMNMKTGYQPRGENPNRFSLTAFRWNQSCWCLDCRLLASGTRDNTLLLFKLPTPPPSVPLGYSSPRRKRPLWGSNVKPGPDRYRGKENVLKLRWGVS